MRIHFLLLTILLCTTSSLQAQSPPDMSGIKFDLPPAQNFAPPPPAQIQAPPITPVQSISPPNSNGSVKAGEPVRLLRRSVVRSGPDDQSYPCNSIEAGRTVIMLDLPKYGSDYTAIKSPEDCYSLIPEGAIYILYRPKTFLTAPQPVRYLVETLIDGDVGNGEFHPSNFKLPKGSLVDVVAEKKIRIQGKLKNYCVVRNDGKEVRYVKTADLEGVANAARQAQSQAGFNQSPLQGNWPGNTNTSSATLESEHLSPQVAGQVQAADQAYQAALHNGVWEDARMRYQYLLECEVLSIRILAKNRLEYIREWQQNPPVQTSTAATAQTGYASMTMNTDPWVPGEVAARQPRLPAQNTSMPAPVKEVVIRPTAPTNTPNNNTLPNSPLHNIPVYQGQPQQPTYQPPPAAAPAKSTPTANQPYVPQQPRTALPATPPSAQRTKTMGKLNRAVQYSPNQLYYLTNSQGFLTYYLRGVGAASQQLAGAIGKIVEVEGMAIQAPIEGQLKNQINVETVRLVQ